MYEYICMYSVIFECHIKITIMFLNYQVGKLLRSVERRAVTVRVRRGGTGGSARREDEPKRLRTNFSFRRVSEVMEGVRLQGMRTAVSKNNLTVSVISQVLLN